MATEKPNIQAASTKQEWLYFVQEAWQEYKGIVYALTAAICYSISDVLIYASSDKSHPLIILVWISGWMFILDIVFLVVKRPDIPYVGNSSYKPLLILALIGCMAGTGDFALTIANLFTSPADAVAINYTAPIHAGIFSVILLHDRCRLWDIIFIIISVIGVFLVVRPPLVFGEPVTNTDTYYVLGILLAIFSAVMTGSTFVIGTYLGQYDIAPLIVLFFIGLAEIIISIFLSIIFQTWESTTSYTILHVVKLTSVGVFWFGGTLLAFMAVQIERPTLVTIILTLESFLVFLGEYLFLDLTILWSEYIGAVLIAVACIGSTAVRYKQASPNKTTDGGDEELLLMDQN